MSCPTIQSSNYGRNDSNTELNQTIARSSERNLNHAGSVHFQMEREEPGNQLSQFHAFLAMTRILIFWNKRLPLLGHFEILNHLFLS